jgi:2-polyprenyl-3-methyl-5-hydroxy-6-metoxy-1,4-benzoquinol methylase
MNHLESLTMPAVIENAAAHVEHIACSLCGTDDAVEIIPSTLAQVSQGNWSAYACTSSGYGRHGPIVRCQNCGLVYANPRPQNNDVLDIYEAVKDPLYVEEREGRILTFEHHLKPMEAFTGAANGRRLLDVGAYTGVFVEIAARHGWDAWGIEPSAWAVSQAEAQGLQMILGTLENAHLSVASFDAVTMWDVIEHVTNPLETLQAAWHALKPGGYLVVHTMDLDSLFACLMGRRWPWFMEMHLFYFTRRTMAMVLKQTGFDVVWMGAQGRYLQAGYLASRVTALSPQLGKPLEFVVDKLKMRNIPLRINLGDLFTTYARKPA